MDECTDAVSFVDLEARVQPAHPLRAIRFLVNEALAVLAVTSQRCAQPLGDRLSP